jgi:hypothetical protein
MPKLYALPLIVHCPGGIATLPLPDAIAGIVDAAIAQEPERARLLASRGDAELEVTIGDRAASVHVGDRLVARIVNEGDHE